MQLNIQNKGKYPEKKYIPLSTTESHEIPSNTNIYILYNEIYVYIYI